MPAASSQPRKRVFSVPRQTFTQIVPAASVAAPAIYLEIDRIEPSPYNPRRKLGDVTQLAESIDTYGLLQPLVVRETDNGYELIAGHRRLAAIQHLRGLDSSRNERWQQVPVIVHTADDEKALLLAGQENLQREDLSPRDQALYLELYVRKYGGVRRAAEVLKLSHTYVGQRCRVFADDVLAGPVMANKLDVSSAQELLRVSDPSIRSRIAEQAIAGGWSRIRIRQEVDRWNVDIPPSAGRAPIDSRIEDLLGELEQIAPETLTSGEIGAARRLMQRLMWMLGPAEHAAEVGASANDSGPRILNWAAAADRSQLPERNVDIPVPEPASRSRERGQQKKRALPLA